MVKPHEVILKKLETYFYAYPSMTYKKGETILRAEDTPLGISYLKTGFVHQFMISPSGETFMIHIFKPGSFFPLAWVVNDTPNMFHFEAMTPVTIIRAPKESFLTFIQSQPDVLFYAMQRLAAGLSGLVTRVGQLVLDDAYTKTILLLVYYAANFGEKTQQGIMIGFPLTHREIASWIGTTRETASLQVERLEKKNLITIKGRKIVIPNIEVLQKELNR